MSPTPRSRSKPRATAKPKRATLEVAARAAPRPRPPRPAAALVLPHRAVAARFVERQWLDRPLGRTLTAASLAEFAARTGGVQIDSINVLDRAHYLTLWSRFGVYDRAELDRLIYRDHVLFEYWAHAACFVPRSHGPMWRRAMLDYRARHQGWGKWLRSNRRVLGAVERMVQDSGPLGSADVRERRPRGAGGWWSWKPATFAFHFLWMSGRLAVHERVHFQKRFDLTERVLPDVAAAAPPDWDEFLRWHVRQSLRAMGAATEPDLRQYLSYPRIPAPARRRVLESLVRSGEVREVAVEGSGARWFALAEEVPAIQTAADGPAAAGTALLAPFDSLLWHRERVRALFGYDYRIEVYTPQAKRVLGYYSLPIVHDGRLIGRVDAKHHRGLGWLEVRHAHFEPWFARGKPEPVPGGRPLDRDAALAGVGRAIASLAAFLRATRVSCARVSPAGLTRPLERAIRAAAPSAPRAGEVGAAAENGGKAATRRPRGAAIGARVDEPAEGAS